MGDFYYFKLKAVNNTLKRMEWKQNILCPCLVYQNVEGLRKPGMLWGLLACFLPCVSIMVLRKEARDQYGIGKQGCCRFGTPTFYVGSIAEDTICLLCCTACVNCQTGAEIKKHND